MNLRRVYGVGDMHNAGVTLALGESQGLLCAGNHALPRGQFPAPRSRRSTVPARLQSFSCRLRMMYCWTMVIVLLHDQ